jgi:UPF0755 protein
MSSLTAVSIRVAQGVGIVLVVAIVALGLHYRSATRSLVLQEGESAEFLIPKGSSWDAIVERLESSGVIQDPATFRVWARLTELPPEVKAGSFVLEGPMRWRDVAEALRRGGQPRDIRVTFLEGWTIYHIADHLEAEGVLERSSFLEAATDPPALEAAGLEDHRSFEGYLFPDTYRFRKGVSADTVVQRMHGTWKEVWKDVAEGSIKQLEQLRERYGFDRHDFVTLASIVEVETSVDEERPMVARVIYNRLDASMRLQTDPTCVYGPETYDDVPRPSHCKDPDNPYSTYTHDGLPPGPIANPSRASLQAALNPSEAEGADELLFYVAKRDGTGRHYFSTSYAEHRRAVDRFLRD